MSDQEPSRQSLSQAWPITGLAICVLLFILATLHAFLTLFTGSWGGGADSPLLDFTLVAPVAGFVACLIWSIVLFFRNRRPR